MWVPVREAARRLNVPEESVLDLVKRGRVPFSLAGNMKTKVQVPAVARAMERDAMERLGAPPPEPLEAKLHRVIREGRFATRYIKRRGVGSGSS